jgi:hypothetical protein
MSDDAVEKAVPTFEGRPHSRVADGCTLSRKSLGSSIYLHILVVSMGFVLP